MSSSRTHTHPLQCRSIPPRPLPADTRRCSNLSCNRACWTGHRPRPPRCLILLDPPAAGPHAARSHRLAAPTRACPALRSPSAVITRNPQNRPPQHPPAARRPYLLTSWLLLHTQRKPPSGPGAQRATTSISPAIDVSPPPPPTPRPTLAPLPAAHESNTTFRACTLSRPSATISPVTPQCRPGPIHNNGSLHLPSQRDPPT